MKGLPWGMICHPMGYASLVHLPNVLTMSSDEKCGGIPSTTYVALGTICAFSSEKVAMDLGIAILA
eukprot:3780605-Karenia_brevis.AAC.1